MSAELDAAVLDFLLDERLAGRPVSNDDIMAKARLIAHTMEGIDPQFKASEGVAATVEKAQ